MTPKQEQNLLKIAGTLLLLLAGGALSAAGWAVSRAMDTSDKVVRIETAIISSEPKDREQWERINTNRDAINANKLALEVGLADVRAEQRAQRQILERMDRRLETMQ